MKKTLCFILAVLFLLSVFSCAADKGGDKNTSVSGGGTSSETAPEESEYDLLSYSGLKEGLDYDNYSFKILMRDYDRWISDMFADESSVDVVDVAVYKRNLTVSELLNVQFELIKSSNWNYETDGIEVIRAGEDAYDLIIPHARAAFVYANDSLLLDWNKDIGNIDLDREWWDQSARGSFSINNRLYVMIGDISYECTGATCSLLFNKDLMLDLGLDSPYQSVLDNTWTYDKYLTYVQKARDDVNGDSAMTIEDDCFGYVTTSYGGPIEILYTAGLTILSKDEADIPYLSISSGRTPAIIEWFYAMQTDNSMYLFTETSAEVAITKIQPKDVFVEGRALFMDSNIAGIENLRTYDTFNFGVIPWPKYTEELEKYYTCVDAGTNLLCVPMTASVPERTGAVIEALSAEGHHSVLPAYYETALKTKYSRDDESAAMLDIICEGRVFDLGYFNYYLIGEMGNGLMAFMDPNSRDFTSWYKKYESVANRTMKKYLKNYGVES